MKREKADELISKTQGLINQLGGFVHYLKQSEFKGSKFKDTDLVYLTNSES